MNLLGLTIHSVNVEGIFRFMEEVIAQKQRAMVVHLNIHGVNLALKNPRLFGFINRASLVYCDGDGLRWGLRILGYSPPPKITYNVWIWQLAEFCAAKNYRLFLLGSAPGVAEEAAKRIQHRYPSIKIAGAHHGFFQKEGRENDEVIERINAAQTDILLVCFGMPLQEQWLMQNEERLKSHICLNGGAALEYASGRLGLAPNWMIRLQMEWLYRFIQEPRRLFGRYVFGNPYFFYRILRERWSLRQKIHKDGSSP